MKSISLIISCVMMMFCSQAQSTQSIAEKLESGIKNNENPRKLEKSLGKSGFYSYDLYPLKSQIKTMQEKYKTGNYQIIFAVAESKSHNVSDIATSEILKMKAAMTYKNMGLRNALDFTTTSGINMMSNLNGLIKVIKVRLIPKNP